jgi:hypothetical protein
MGERLEILQEQIVSCGTWHAYASLGWIDAGLLAPNPFGSAGDHSEVLLAEFSERCVDSMEKLFFYF